MVFFAAAPAPELPTKDILSWIFDKPAYDVNKPVSNVLVEAGNIVTADVDWNNALTRGV